MPVTIPRRSFVAFLTVLASSRLRPSEKKSEPYQPSFLHPNDRWVALRGDHGHQFEIVDLDSGKSIKTLPSSECDTYSGEPQLFFDPSGRYLLMLYEGHHDWFLKRWELEGNGPGLRLEEDVVASERLAVQSLGANPGEQFHSVPRFSLPAPGNILRFQGSDRDLQSFRLIQKRKVSLKDPVFVRVTASCSCVRGHPWLIGDPTKPFSAVTPSANPKARWTVSRMPMCWEPHEASGGGRGLHAAPRRNMHSVLVWSGFSTVREIECPSGKLLRCVSGSMPQTGLVAFGSSRHIVYAARPLDTAVRWNRLGQSRKVRSLAQEETEKPPIDELGMPLKSGDSLEFEKGTRVLSALGPRLALGREDGRVVLGSSGSRQGGPWITLGQHSGAVRALAFDPGQPRLISGARDGSLKVWNVDTGKCLRDLAAHGARINALVVMPGDRSASAGPDGIRIVDLASGRLIRHIETGGVWVSDLTVSPDGTALVSAMLDGTLRRWDPQTGAQLWSIDAGEGWCATTAFHPKGTMVASGYELGALALWDPSNGKRIKRIHVDGKITWQSGCRSVHAVAWSPGGEVLAAGFGDAVRVYDVQLTSGPGPGWLLPLDWADYYT